jgi:hypothetical protein
MMANGMKAIKFSYYTFFAQGVIELQGDQIGRSWTFWAVFARKIQKVPQTFFH